MYNPGSTIKFREALESSTVPVMYASMRASRGCKPRLFKPFDFFDHTGKIVLLGPPDRHVNHSCDPNAYVLYEGDRSFLVARRDIAVGQEITCDYNINITGGTAWPCHCGTARCTGTTVGDFFRLPVDIQREYRPLLAEWFVRAHRDRLRALGLA
jgi:hypothetical protein